MDTQPVSRRQQVWRIVRWIVLGIALIGALGIALAAFDHYGWSSGTRSQVIQVGPDAVYTPGKTLWDWLDLLIIPIFLAVGALWANRISQRNEQQRADRENEIERQIASERNQEAALQTYLDRMTDLLLNAKLRDSAPEDEVRIVARTRTLTILRTVESERKATIMRFLIETGLLSGKTQPGSDVIQDPVISLLGADLRGVYLEAAPLSGVDFRQADLSQADLHRSVLSRADLREANLSEANLNMADLSNADMGGADLSRSNLESARMDGANLMDVDLSGANLGGANLSRASLGFADLREARLGAANLSEANLGSAKLNNAFMVAAKLNKARLNNVKFDGAILQMADFSDALMPNGEIYDPAIPLEEQCKIPNEDA